MQSVKGIVDSRIFMNEESGFGIFRIVLFNSNEKPLVIKGDLAQLDVESFYEFRGEYREDPRFGMQFNVESYHRILPDDADFIVRYLSGPSFPGIGQKTAEAIVEAYGESVLEDIKNSENFEISVKGLSKAKAQDIVKIIRYRDPEEEAVSFLMAGGLSHKQILKINKTYGEKSVQLIQENPYRLVYDVDGIGFKTADKFAQNIGFDVDDPLRIQAKILDNYKTMVFGRGDSFIDVSDFLSVNHGFERVRVEDAFQALLDMRELVLDDTRLYHISQYESEVHVANTLLNLPSRVSEFEIESFDSKILKVQEQLSIAFDANQIDAIQSFFENDVMILTGGPGTGKSTLLAGIVSLLQAHLPWHHVTLCAPTGRAAKRLENLTNVQAATVHSILKWDLETNQFGMDEETPLETDVLIIDEFSMVDIWLLSSLLKASSKVKKFLFVGDQDQLPSVGSGYVLGDLIASKQFKVIELERNYRQESGSEVIDLALAMNRGEFDIHAYNREVRFFDSRYGSVKDIVLKIVEEALNKGYSLNDVQVLAPMYDGPAGIDNLNYFLQKMCNPESSQKGQIQVGTRIFREGDKILQLKNQPDDFVFNGDIGMLVEAAPGHLVVDFDGNFVEYGSSDFINISHAYAMSVHKAQGSEYPIVILVAVKRFYKMLSRKLYYTAVTRSSKSLVLVGEENAFKQAVDNHHEVKRNTYLVERLLVSKS